MNWQAVLSARGRILEIVANLTLEEFHKVIYGLKTDLYQSQQIAKEAMEITKKARGVTKEIKEKS